jgi:hypothetical protein
MEQNPSWEANEPFANQEKLEILWNPKVHYALQNSLILVPVHSQINPLHTVLSCFSKIHFNIIISLHLGL